MKQTHYETVALEKIVGGGQALGTLEDGRKAFVWNGLPGESVTFRVTKKKSHFVEGIVTEAHTPNPERIIPLDPESYLSTSPWQIMTFAAEQHCKAALIEEAFELHDIVLPDAIDVYSDNVTDHYRNKVEFSWFGSMLGESLLPERQSTAQAQSSPSEAAPNGVNDAKSDVVSFDEDFALAKADQDEKPLAVGRSVAKEMTSASQRNILDLAFFQRGSKGKIIVDQCSLLPDSMMNLAHAVRDLLQTKPDITARNLKTLLIRCDQQGNCVWQLYIKDELPDIISVDEAAALPAQGGEVIYSDPRSPASRITKRLTNFGDIVLSDTILDVPFRYATEGFFQVNIPVYEQALRDMREWVQDKPAIDLYSGVGTIGLTIGGDDVTLVEISEDAVREMRRNITELGRESSAGAVLAPSEKALDEIHSDNLVIVDPPRAGLHADVIAKLLETAPERIIYLSCNPVTQARDVALLAETYGIRAHRGYNFFPRTPHIEHLVVLDKKA